METSARNIQEFMSDIDKFVGHMYIGKHAGVPIYVNYDNSDEVVSSVIYRNETFIYITPEKMGRAEKNDTFHILFKSMTASVSKLFSNLIDVTAVSVADVLYTTPGKNTRDITYHFFMEKKYVA